MHVTYRSSFSTGATRSRYSIVIETDTTVEVKDLISVMNDYETSTMYQEDITRAIAERFKRHGWIKVTTEGDHGHVNIVCAVELE
jgi:hypothetical protein